MALTVDGTSIVWTGTTTVTNGFNPDTGVAYLILTPDGGVGELPFLATGDSGLPPVFDQISVVEVDPAQALPSPNPVVTMVSAGGSGVASHYTMTFYLHKGDTGSAGDTSISTAIDLASTPALGAGTDGYILVYSNANSDWTPTAPKVGSQYIPAAIAATAFNTASTRLLASVSVPAQPFNWRPRCFGQSLVQGSLDTQINLVARLNDADSGDQVAFGAGITGILTSQQVVLMPASPGGSNVPGNYGLVAAGASATIYFRAEQRAPSILGWSTPADPQTTFWVEVAPL